MAWDSTLAFLREGYTFIAARCDARGVNAFQTRLLGKKTVCLRGPSAARFFSDETMFTRKNAAPRRLLTTLLGKGGVQGLDGAEHQHRKAMFLALMAPARVDALALRFRELWLEAIPHWQTQSSFGLFDALQELVCRAVCDWAGVPLDAPGEARRRTRDMALLIESAGSLGAKYWRGKRARKRSERWAMRLIRSVRDGGLQPGEDTALSVIALHEDMHGARLPLRVAAVELLNVIRPTVAVARFMAFEAMALFEHPEWSERIRGGEDPERFVLEVRRLTPFFPFATARAKVRTAFEGVHIAKGQRVILDLYGTLHHDATFEDAKAFRPERFAMRPPGEFDMIPQGAGEHRVHHRCPGEWITVALMKVAAELLTRSMTYDVPAQDLTVDLRQMPALPRSRLTVSNVRPAIGVAEADDTHVTRRWPDVAPALV